MGVLTLFLVGLVFSLAAFISIKFPPKKINGIYGYRTSRSMKSQENWDTAQRYSSRLMLKQGLVMLAIAGLLNVLPLPEEVAAIISVALLILSVIVLFVQTEKKLK
jgi:uncharacterized membrane protein